MGGPSLLVPPKALLASSWFIAVKWTVQGCVKGCTASALLLQAADRLPLLSRVGCVAAVQAARAAASEARRRRACRSKLPAVSAAVTFNPNSCSRWLTRLGLDLRLCHLPDVNSIRWVLLLALQGGCSSEKSEGTAARHSLWDAPGLFCLFVCFGEIHDAMRPCIPAASSRKPPRSPAQTCSWRPPRAAWRRR